MFDTISGGPIVNVLSTGVLTIPMMIRRGFSKVFAGGMEAAASSGGSIMPLGPLGENHLGIVSVDGSTNVSIKVPHLRNQYDKVGFEMGRTDSRAGFGFLHDGSVDSLSRFVSARAFDVQSDQEVADLIALMMAFSGSDFGDANPILGAPPPESGSKKPVKRPSRSSRKNSASVECESDPVATASTTANGMSSAVP